MYDESKLNEIGQRIKKARQIKKLTQPSLGEKIGLPKSSISKIENGNQSPTIKQIADIANVLSIRIEYLLGLDNVTDDETKFISGFIKSFDRITTTNKYTATKKNSDVHNVDDFVFEINDHYLVLTGNKNLFVLIEEIAGAENLKSESSKAKYNRDLKAAKQKFKENKANGDEESYFLVSGKQMTEIIESAVIEQGYLKTLFSEIGLTTPLDGQPLPKLK